jgi:hypothetical protein
VIDEQPALRRALVIHGAQSISMVSLSTGTAIWSAGAPSMDAVAAGEADAEPEADQAVGGAVADLIGVAARMVGLTDGGALMDDLVLSSASWFHVLRVGGGPRLGPCVIHLMLDRRVANLALARRELKGLTELAFQLPVLESGPVVDALVVDEPAPEAEVEVEVEVETDDTPPIEGTGKTFEVLDETLGPEVLEIPVDLRQPPEVAEELPQRSSATKGTTARSRHSVQEKQDSADRLPEEASGEPGGGAPGRGAPGMPAWLAQFAGQPFESDLDTIERVLAGLRGLKT